MSTDNTVDIINKHIAGDERFKLVINKTKKYALGNIVEAIDGLECKDEDINILLDGDDWFASSKTLCRLCDAYEDDTLMTYGSYVYNPGGQKGVEPSEYPEEVIKNNTFRQDQWRASHLRTFKYKLWKHLDKNDLKENDKYYEMAYDQAIMLPLLEMASERSKYIPEVLHIYNKENPLNVDKIKEKQQFALAQKIRSKESYTKI
jgi:glycosyltransferase involved in cell wall biosynthesis